METGLPFERTRSRILQVNHAGECGAIAIYGAQISLSFLLPAETRQFLRHAVGHEREHAAKFRAAMKARGIRPLPCTMFWVCGGFLLGLISLFGGNRGVMACTAAIEQAVHGHLDEQIAWLRGRDEHLATVISGILVEEIQHKEHGEAGFDPECALAAAYTGMIRKITDGLIWLTTYGDSARLKHAMQ